MMVSAIGRPSCDKSWTKLSTRPRCQLRTYLDVVALVVVTTLTEEPVRHDLMYVEFIEHWIRVLQGVRVELEKKDVSHLAQTCGEDDDFVYLSHTLQKVVHPRSFQDMEMVPMIFNLHWNNEVCLLDSLGKQSELGTKRPRRVTLKLL